MNSKPFGYLVSVQLARTELAQSYEVGLIQQTPIPDDDDRAALAALARRAWLLKRTLDTAHETSHAYLGDPISEIVRMARIIQPARLGRA